MRKILFVLMVLVTSAAFSQGVRLKTNIAGFGGAHFAGVPPGYTKLNVRYEFVAMAIDSGLHIPQYNGVPSGVRSGVWQADGAIAADTLNGYLYQYWNGAWVKYAKYSDISAGAVDLIWREPGIDSIFWSKNGVDYKILDSTGVATNIYNSDGTLTGNRSVSGQHLYGITFDSTFFLVKGILGSGPAVSSYNNSQMFFYPAKAAFRAGQVNSTQWDDANIGTGSFAGGQRTTASGQRSTAFGYENTSSGIATFTVGESNTANIDYASAIGYNNISTGLRSVALGSYLKAKHFSGVVVGHYNDSTNATSSTFNTANRAFQIGIGASDAARANAMTVLFSGNVGIGTTTPAKVFHTVGTVRHASLGTASSDSTTYKPVGVDSNGDIIPMTSWFGGGMTNPMTTTGDIIYSSDNSGTPARLAAGTSTYVLTSNGAGAAPSWQASSGGGAINVADSLSWIDVRYHGARDDGKEVSDAAISSGTAILTSATASFSADDVGKYIRVGGAGAAGVELLTTIAGYTNSTTVTLTDNASTTVSSQRILWGTDNTAYIQAAINAAVSGENASGTVVFRKYNTGRYLVADSNQATTSQLYIPTATYSPSATNHKSIRLLGMQTQTYFIDYVTGQKSPSTGIIIQSMRNDSAYSILGSGSSSSAYGFHNWTMVYLENLTFRAVSLNGTTNIEPLQSGIDFQLINMCDLRNVIVQTESDNFNSVRPDTSTFGIRLPYNNNGGYVRLDNVMVERFNSGIVASENVIGDNVWINACYNGWEFVTGTHPSFIKKSLVEWCVNGIMVSGANPNFNFGLYVIETYPTDISTKWFNTVYDLYVNTGSPGSGNLNYYRVKGGTGVEMNGLTRNDAATTSNYVFTKFNDSNPIEILRDSTNQFRVVSASNPSVFAKINSNNRTDILFTKSNVSMYAIGQGDSTNTTENFHLYSYARSKYDMFINSSGNVQLGGTDARTTPQFTLRRSTGNANFGEGGDSAFNGAVNIYRSATGAASPTGVGSAIHFVNPSATGQIHMTYRINGGLTGSFTSDYTGNNSFVGTTSHTFYVGATGKQLINTNGVLITGDQIMHGTARKLYWTNSGTAADANWKTGYEVSPSNAQIVTGAAVVHDVYGGAANYGYMVRKTGGTSLFEIQGSDGKAYFAGSVGMGTAAPTAKLHIAAGATGASTAPLKLTTGTNNTTAEAGALEYTTPQLFFTNGRAVRQEIPQIQQSRVSTQYDNATTTLGNVTGLTANVAASGTYRFEARLYTTSDVGGGVKVAIAGTATATAIIYEGLTTNAGSITQSRATALATAVGAVTAVTAAYVVITGTITVNAAGTLTVQAAANAATGTTSVLVGSTFVLTEMN